jgi:hypothetical protein
MPTIKYAEWTTGNDWSGNGGADSGGYTGVLSAWVVDTTYALGNRVCYGTAPTRYVWRSLQNGNVGNTPSESAWWTLVADGSASKPWRSITDADDGLTGGDEVRVGKSPARTSAGNLVWTDGSTSITLGTGNTTDLTTIFAARNFITKDSAGGPGDTEPPWEVASATSTVVTLSYAYRGTTTAAAGVASSKLGVTDTGIVATSGATAQMVGTSGSSPTSLLLISGGWDLAAEAASPSAIGTRGNATGQTWLWQSGNNRYGWGLYRAINYVESSDFGFLRYNIGLGFGSPATGAACNRVTRCTAASCPTGVSLGSAVLWQIVNLVTACCSSFHVAATLGTGCSITNMSMIGPSGSTLATLFGLVDCAISGLTVNTSTGIAMFMQSCRGIRFSNLTVTNGSSVVLQQSGCSDILILSGTYSSAWPHQGIYHGDTGPAFGQNIPGVFFESYGGTPGDDRITWGGGQRALGYREATGGPDSLGDLKVNPLNASYYSNTGDLCSIWCPASADVVLSVQLKRSGTYTAGDVQLGAYSVEDGAVLVADANATVTTDWATYTVTVPAATLTVGQLVALRISMKRQSGSDLAVFIGPFMGTSLSKWHNARPVFPLVASSAGGWSPRTRRFGQVGVV